MSTGKFITRRKDLKRVPGAAELRSLFLEGPGVGSLEGIHEMQALEGLSLERVRAPRLDLLEELPSLTGLTLDEPTRDTDLTPIGRLTGLRYLSAQVEDRRHAETLAELDFGQFAKLEWLELNFLEPRPTVPISLAWLPSSRKLRVLRLTGFTFGARDAELLCAAGDQFTNVAFTPESEAQREAVLNGLPRSVRVSAIDLNSPETGVVHEIKLPDGRLVYTLALDLAGRWGLETNVEARDLLAEELDAHSDLRDKVRLDVEGSAVWLDADLRDDLAAIERIIDAMPPAPS